MNGNFHPPMVRFRLMAVLHWGMFSAFNCYYVMFLREERGVSATGLGALMAVYTCSAIAGQYLLGFLCDKIGARRPVYIAIIIAVAAAIASFPRWTGQAALYAVMAAIGFLQSPLSAIIDSWIFHFLARSRAEKRYGTIRLFGSLGWALNALFTAFLINKFGFTVIFYICAGYAAALVAAAAITPDARPVAAEKEGIRLRTALGRLLRVKSYVFIVAVAFLLFMGEQTAYNFVALLMKDSGGDVIMLGFNYLFSAGSEVPTMFLSVWLLRRWSAKRVLTAAVVAYALRFIIILLFRTPQAVVVAAVCEGIGYGLFITSFRNYIYAVAPPELRTTAMAVSDAVYLNVAVIIGGTAGGVLIDAFGIYWLVAASLGLTLAALALLLGNWFLAGRKTAGRFLAPVAEQDSAD
ncbi:MAG: MFS transporter [Negativicutes bacterium]|nr:MFS transporter [Negativicutes bacterium]